MHMFCNNMVGKSEVKEPLRSLRDGVRLVSQLHVVHVRDKWLAPVNTVLGLWVLGKTENVLTP